ncbi:MAG: TonB-dependent receptor plug domain-containing protein [Desulfuromonadales bacterium]|nr:TonB-dependent receptor plug domain-containing protein [Desulfuromonadales bacterium]
MVSSLEPVVVIGVVENSATGKTSLTSEQLSVLPIRNDSLNEALATVPGVQYSDTENASTTAGEIRPPSLSISGGRIYQNNFQIDGFSNNSLLDPDEESTNSGTVVQGHPQELFVSPHLLESVTVYGSNVSAEYGSFTGGVVDARLVRPKETFSGNVYYRTTRDQWTSFHVDPADQEDFSDSNSDSNQPRFAKHDFGTLLNLPVTGNSGLVLSYQQLQSSIPLLHFGETTTQHRRSENIFVKYGVRPDPRNYAEISLLYTPYSGKYFRKNTMNSDYTVHGGGLLTAAVWERQLAVGFLEVRTGYRRSENSRDAPLHLFGWAPTSTKPWGGTGPSYEGMLGDLEQSQETWQVKADLTSRTLQSGGMTHVLKTGIDLEHIIGTYDRPVTSWQFYRYNNGYFPNTAPVTAPLADTVPESSVICDPDDIACISSEQYFNRRFVFEAASQTVHMNLLGLYLQDTIDLRRLQFRPGVRVSYDDFMDNLDIAPRLAAAYDLFGDGRTRLIAGVNRYYGKTLLTYKLREAIGPSNVQELRGLILDPDGSGEYVPDDWNSYLDGSIVYTYSSAKTPYKDEITAGFEQQLLGGLLAFRYINRQGRDEFAREYEVISGEFNRYRLTNNGRSSYEAYLVDWACNWEGHYLDLNVTYQESTTGNESYTSSLTDIQLERKIWYKGALIAWDERPRENYSRPWVANLVYSGNFGQHFSFINITNYRGPYFALKDSKKNAPDGNDIYERVRQPGSVVFDWILSWTAPVAAEQFLTIKAELYNVFNRKTHLGDADDEYELGRQFWAGVEYTF